MLALIATLTFPLAVIPMMGDVDEFDLAYTLKVYFAFNLFDDDADPMT